MELLGDVLQVCECLTLSIVVLGQCEEADAVFNHVTSTIIQNNNTRMIIIVELEDVRAVCLYGEASG